MCKAVDNERPTVCEVEGCESKKRVFYRKSIGMATCGACYHAWKKNGHFNRNRRTPSPIRPDRPAPAQCEVDGCDGNNKIIWQPATKMYVCNAHYLYYVKHGKYGHAIKQRGYRQPPPVCEICRVRPPDYYGCADDRKKRRIRWRCNRCWTFKVTHNKERPRILVHDECRNPACKRPKPSELRLGRYCTLCRNYKRRTGRLPTAEYIAKYAPHGWCECGKPATAPVDLRTGGLLVVPTNAGFSDYLTETRQEYTEWMCDECAGLEAEMQDIDTSDYRPTGYFNSREGNR